MENEKLKYYSLLLNIYSSKKNKMIPKNLKKVLLFLTKNINQFGFNINQIAKLNKISVGNAFNILKQLKKDNLVIETKINNAIHYKINFNRESLLLIEFLLINEKKDLHNYIKIYVNEIIKFDDASIILLFGSILKNKNFNDVDVMFISNNTKKISSFCLHLSKLRTKPIVPLILKKEDLIKEIKNKNETILNIIKNSVIIKGEYDFLEVIKNVQN